MANAVVVYEEVVKPIKCVTLSLSKEEAECVKAIFGNFGCNGPTSDIYDALDRAGVDSGKYNIEMDGEKVYNTLHAVEAE